MIAYESVPQTPMRMDVRARGMSIFDRCDDGFVGSTFLSGSGEDTSVDIPLAESSTSFRSPRNEAWWDGQGKASRHMAVDIMAVDFQDASIRASCSPSTDVNWRGRRG